MVKKPSSGKRTAAEAGTMTVKFGPFPGWMTVAGTAPLPKSTVAENADSGTAWPTVVKVATTVPVTVAPLMLNDVVGREFPSVATTGEGERINGWAAIVAVVAIGAMVMALPPVSLTVTVTGNVPVPTLV